MKATRIVCLAILSVLTTVSSRAADALVFYQNSAAVAALEAVNPGQVYYVPQVGLANPAPLGMVLLYPPTADLTAPFQADLFGIIDLPDPGNPSVTVPFLFLASDVLEPSLDLGSPPPGVTPVPDNQLVYDATGFLAPGPQAAGLTVQFVHGVPEISSTLFLLSLGVAAVGILRRRV